MPLLRPVKQWHTPEKLFETPPSPWGEGPGVRGGSGFFAGNRMKGEGTFGFFRRQLCHCFGRLSSGTSLNVLHTGEHLRSPSFSDIALSY